MAARLDRKRLTVVVLDPWELRYAGEHELGDKADALRRILQETVHRERPQLLIVLKTDKALLRAASRISRALKLPLLAFTQAKVKRLAVASGKARRNDHPITGHARLAPAMALARAALSNLLRDFYCGEHSLKHSRSLPEYCAGGRCHPHQRVRRRPPAKHFRPH